MNPDVLAQLKDIQTPAQVGTWPLAWGWWVVIVLSVLVLIGVIYWLVKSYQLRTARRQALELLSKFETAEPSAKAAGINQVLKRANLAYQNRESVAELSGKEWADWLNHHNEKVQISPELIDLCYRPNCSEEEAQLYYLQAQQWLKKALPLKPVKMKEASHV